MRPGPRGAANPDPRALTHGRTSLARRAFAVCAPAATAPSRRSASSVGLGAQPACRRGSGGRGAATQRWKGPASSRRFTGIGVARPLHCVEPCAPAMTAADRPFVARGHGASVHVGRDGSMQAESLLQQGDADSRYEGSPAVSNRKTLRSVGFQASVEALPNEPERGGFEPPVQV